MCIFRTVILLKHVRAHILGCRLSKGSIEFEPALLRARAHPGRRRVRMDGPAALIDRVQF